MRGVVGQHPHERQVGLLLPSGHRHGRDDDRRKAQGNQRRDGRPHALDAQEPQQHVARHGRAGQEHGADHRAQPAPRHAAAEHRQQHHRADGEAPERDVLGREAVLGDEKFANRSLGVVSMLGLDQAKHIDSVVRRRCDAAELLRRRFECGDARTFQGSERDIMFLSLVVDQQNCKAVSGNMFDQRFNVAASRARDRMYLVRSVKMSDLSDKDLRLTLLSHFDTPIIIDKEEAENLLDRCESGFEQQVFKALTSKGYRVVPQVKTGAYRLDMVVEGGADTRLAIECDGDEFHGPDRWQHDMNRQRVLERAGWVFWRCFASTWALRKDEVLGELVDRLTAMGIAPVGAIDRAPSLVEKRTWQPPTVDADGNGKDAVAMELDAAVEGAAVGKT